MDQLDITKIRYALGLTQKELADALDCTQGFVSKLEKGERSLSLDQRVVLRNLVNAKKKVVVRRPKNEG